MAMQMGLRERKKLQTKRAIAEVATRLFMMRGFESVTVADVAAAANVATMTVFNYFPRKEDIFFDRADENKQIIRNALVQQGQDLSAADAMRKLSQQLINQGHPFATFNVNSVRYWKTVAESSVLSARVREISDEMSKDVAAQLAESVGRPRSDAEANLFGCLLMASLTAAHTEALRLYCEKRSSNAAQKAFLNIFDRGVDGISAALKGTPYV